MTNDQIVAYQRRQRELRASGQTFAPRLREAASVNAYGAALMRRADLGGWTERQMGDFSPGRYGWELNKIQPLAEPIPYRGLQGLFNVPDELLARERETA